MTLDDFTPLPDMPTTHPPGTSAKEAVFRQRLAEKVQLHHPADARYEGDTMPLAWLKWKEEREKASMQRILDLIKSKKALEKQGNGES